MKKSTIVKVVSAIFGIVLVTGCSQAIHQANETYYQYQIAEREAYADAIAAVKDNPTAVLAIAMAYQGKHMTYGQRIDTVADYLRAIGATVRDVTPLVNTVVQRDGGGSGGHISAGRDVIFHSTKADRISAGAGVSENTTGHDSSVTEAAAEDSYNTSKETNFAPANGNEKITWKSIMEE